MNEFKVIEVMNEAMLEVLKEKNENYDKNLKIKQYLQDEAFFFKIKKIDAYRILENVGVKKDHLEEVYNKLTEQNVFYELVHKGKININDENLTIKYKMYGREDLFKK